MPGPVMETVSATSSTGREVNHSSWGPIVSHSSTGTSSPKNCDGSSRHCSIWGRASTRSRSKRCSARVISVAVRGRVS